MHNEHMDREVKKGIDLVDGKSLKVRNMVLAGVSVPLSVIGGRIVAWDG